MLAILERASVLTRVVEGSPSARDRHCGRQILARLSRVEKGTVLDEKYELLEMIGQGGMGAVWRAWHLGLNSAVALKLMSPELIAQPEALQRFTREAQAAARLRSPHVVQILDHGVDRRTNEPFIVMELLEGQSLSARIRQRGGLAPRETSKIIAQVAVALTLAHAEGIVHRDLKPENIFLVKHGKEEIAKVLDFGIAKSTSQLAGTQAQTATGSALGTPYYMSPEQIDNAKGVDHRSDLWSLVVIACECLTGKRPFQADSVLSLAVKICKGESTPPSILGRVPEGFDEWFARGTALHRDRRFQTANELSESLQELFEQAPPSSARPPLEVRWLWPATLMVAALVVGSTVWLLTRSTGETFDSAPTSASPAPPKVEGAILRVEPAPDPKPSVPTTEAPRPKIDVVLPEAIDPELFVREVKEGLQPPAARTKPAHEASSARPEARGSRRARPEPAPSAPGDKLDEAQPAPTPSFPAPENPRLRFGNRK
jgi:serine/threonine protein kinase